MTNTERSSIEMEIHDTKAAVFRADRRGNHALADSLRGRVRKLERRLKAAEVSA